MARIIGSPSRYIQGKGTLAEITKYTERLGKKLLILVSKSGKKRVEEKINKAVEGTDTTVVWEIFNGECSKSEVNRMGEILKKEKCDIVVGIGLNPKRQFDAWLGRKKDKSRQAMEERILRKVKYYMGRTNWDKNITQFYNPNSSYYYCSEALRKEFLQTAIPWTPPQNKKFRIVTTGVSSFWKGIDTILRTAHKLKEYGLEFEWILAGKINSQIKSVVERKEKMKYKDNDITIAGFLNPSQLKDLLMSANLYVHTAYIDNSPNAICEAQYLGMPIVATYVGGIPSLIDNNKEGILIPANDPFTLAGKIIELSRNEDLCMAMGKASMDRARERHNPDNIVKDLMFCYKSIVKDINNKVGNEQ